MICGNQNSMGKVDKVKNIKASAYIRDSKEYSSDMEVNYA